MITVDTETHLIRPGVKIPPLVCTTFKSAKYEGILLRDRIDTGVWAQIKGWGESKLSTPAATMEPERFWEEVLRDDRIVGHNIAYDLAVVVAAYPALQPLIWKALDEGRVIDTMIRAKLLSISLGRLRFDPTINAKPRFSLAACAKRYLGQEVAKGSDTWRLRYEELDGIGLERWPPEAVEYAINDARVTDELYRKIQFESPDEPLQVRALFAFTLMSAWGMVTDQVAVQELRDRLEAICVDYEKELYPVGIVDQYGKRNMSTIRDILVKSNPESPTTNPSKRHPKGQIKTDAITLRDSEIPILATLADYLEVKKNLTDFIPKLRPLVQCSFNSLVSTGRAACYGPNLEQVPRKGGVRECFIPRAGNVYVIADVSAAELCAIAELCYDLFGFSKMGDQLREGGDIHMLVGARLMGVQYEAAVEARQRWKRDPTHQFGKEMNDARELGKRGNFGFWGGFVF